MITSTQQNSTTLLATSIMQQNKPTKVTKVRRTRQPRNPQLSVARRNERERNRVKMVNNGFALLREHLPIDEHTTAASLDSGSETPTPDGGKQSQGRVKKFSKVETLRAAIQRIKMLEELIRSTDPSFESIHIVPSAHRAQLAAYDEEPLSMAEAPPSCGSASSNSITTTSYSQQRVANSQQSVRHITYSLNEQINSPQSARTSHPHPQTNEHFIKLEPSLKASMAVPSIPADNNNQLYQQQQQQHQHHQQPMPSPHHSLNSPSGLNSPYQPTGHMHQSPVHTQLASPLRAQQPQSATETTSHTQLWLQRHQNSFLEQQQMLYEQQQQQQQRQQQIDSTWYGQQQQQQQEQQTISAVWMQQSTDSPDYQQQQTPSHQSSQVSPASPVWFNQSPSSVSSNSVALQHSAAATAAAAGFGHQPQHQISLYSR